MVERWILAALRKRTFFSLGELNQAIAELLVRLNERPFRKREGSRQSLFETLDRPALRPLPAERYQYGEWDTRPRQHRLSRRIRQPLVQRALPARPARGGSPRHGLHGGDLPSGHPGGVARTIACPRTVTRPSTSTGRSRISGIWSGRRRGWSNGRPASARRPRNWSTASSPSNRHPEQGYRSCLGVIRLGEKYSHARVEAAARRALAFECLHLSKPESHPGKQSRRPGSRRPARTPAADRPPQPARPGLLRNDDPESTEGED